MDESMELLIEREGERTFLLSPGVGIFTCSLPQGRVLVAGEPAGTLATLGVSRSLVVPAECFGRLVGERPERVHEPVGFGTRLYELEPVGEAATPAAAVEEAAGVADLVVRSAHAGRFWHRPSPTDPAFAEVGASLEDGTPIGLIEVMKTFTHVHYRPAGGLPPRAKLVRFLIEDGGEAEEGAALIEIEPA